MAEAPANDPIVMLTTAELKGLGIERLEDVIHPAYRSRYLFLPTKGMVLDTAALLGNRAFKPGPRPVTIMGPDGKTPIIIAFGDDTEAAEIEDAAIAAYEKAEAQVKKTGTVIDNDTFRDKQGLPPAETFDTRVREHLDKQVQMKKKTRVTGHHYDMNQKYVKGQAMQTVPETPWKADLEARVASLDEVAKAEFALAMGQVGFTGVPWQKDMGVDAEDALDLHAVA